MSQQEASEIRQFVTAGGRLVITGETAPELNGIARAIYVKDDPARHFLAASETDFSATPNAEAESLLSAVGDGGPVYVSGTKNLVVHAAIIQQIPYLFIANFEGIVPGHNLIPTAQIDTSVTVPRHFGSTMHVLPFLGVEYEVRGRTDGQKIIFVIPRIERGAVVWFSSAID
jgi:hypothetical protein